MAHTKCPIWGTPAQSVSQTLDDEVIDSPRAGGRYRITEWAAAVGEKFSERDRLVLTSWLCEQRRAGIYEPVIDRAVLELVKARRLKTVTQRLILALRFLGENLQQLDSELPLFNSHEDHILRCLAETESRNFAELFALYSMLDSSGYLNARTLVGGMRVRPNAAGWQEIERLAIHQSDSSQGFVAMWFSDATTDAYSIA